MGKLKSNREKIMDVVSSLTEKELRGDISSAVFVLMEKLKSNREKIMEAVSSLTERELRGDMSSVVFALITSAIDAEEEIKRLFEDRHNNYSDNAFWCLRHINDLRDLRTALKIISPCNPNVDISEKYFREKHFNLDI